MIKALLFRVYIRASDFWKLPNLWLVATRNEDQSSDDLESSRRCNEQSDQVRKPHVTSYCSGFNHHEQKRVPSSI